MSFRSCRWWPSSTSQILLTFTSALSYFAFIALILFVLFLKKENGPFSSSASNVFSSVTTEVSRSPISPRSLLLTFSSVFSEKSAIFFCAPAPYCRMPFVLARSIWETKASTMAFCSSDRTESSMTSFFSSGCCTGSSGSGSGAPKLKLGISVVSFIKSFMFSILLFFGTET